MDDDSPHSSEQPNMYKIKLHPPWFSSILVSQSAQSAFLKDTETMSKSTLYLLFKILNSHFGLPSSPSLWPKALCLHCSMPQCFLFSFLPSQSFPSPFLVCSRVLYFPLWPSSPLLPPPLPFLCPQSPMFPLSPANVFLFFFLFPVIAP